MTIWLFEEPTKAAEPVSASGFQIDASTGSPISLTSGRSLSRLNSRGLCASAAWARTWLRPRRMNAAGSRLRELDEAIGAYNSLIATLHWFETYVPRRLVKQLMAQGEQATALVERDVHRAVYRHRRLHKPRRTAIGIRCGNVPQ